MQTQVALKTSVIKLLDNMSREQIQSVLDYVQFIESKAQPSDKTSTLQISRTGSFEDLEPIIGALSIGGDAVADSEIYWD